MERRVRYDGDGLGDQVSQETGLNCRDKSRTRQSEKDSCDINLILAKYERHGGMLPDMIAANPIYGDFANALDYRESLHLVSLAEEQFSALGAHIRDRFGNDPAKFLEFATDKANIEEMRKLGLAKPAEAPAAAPSAVAPVGAAAGSGNNPAS